MTHYAWRRMALRWRHDKHRPTPEERDERLVAPPGTTFEQIVESLLTAPPLVDEDEGDEGQNDAN
jgi:hypothetical protein